MSKCTCHPEEPYCICGAETPQRDSGDEDKPGNSVKCGICGSAVEYMLCTKDSSHTVFGRTPQVYQPALSEQVKPSNPKDALGIGKVPSSVIPLPVLAEIGVGMLEGALKYGRHNYRVIGVRGSVYYDATRRHLDLWWEGENDDPDSGLSHITKAITSLIVLRDAMTQESWVDDRPPPSKLGWMNALNEKVKKLLAKYPNPVPAYTAVDEQNKAK